ncbi:MAG: YraN family protein [Spirochaetes bacterium]|nr:YraN family protein [Spirochaetota bacterium]
MTKKEFGRLGEKIALNFLKKNGIKIINENYFTKYGEIDLIGLENETIIFVEVKLRNNFNYGFPIEAVDAKKIKRIKKTAETFLQNFNDFKKCRFDILLIFLYNLNSYKIEWLKDQLLD